MNIKLFEKDNKLNIVDTNNVFVGFDYLQCCCEDFGYCFLNSEEFEILKKDKDKFDIINENKNNYPKYKEKLEINQEFNCEFDVNFFDENVNNDCSNELNYGIFKINIFHPENGTEFLYLIIFNCHNGYYAHGFQFCNNKTVLFSGNL